VVWCSGSILLSVNVVALRWVRLVLGWVISWDILYMNVWAELLVSMQCRRCVVYYSSLAWRVRPKHYQVDGVNSVQYEKVTVAMSVMCCVLQ